MVAQAGFLWVPELNTCITTSATTRALNSTINIVPPPDIGPHASLASIYQSLPTELDQSASITFTQGASGFVTLVSVEPRFYTLVVNQMLLYTGPAIGIIRQIRHYEVTGTILPIDGMLPRELGGGDR